jgi:hypothetical protein
MKISQLMAKWPLAARNDSLSHIRSKGSGLFSQTWKTTLVIAKYIRQKKWRKRRMIK